MTIQDAMTRCYKILTATVTHPISGVVTNAVTNLPVYPYSRKTDLNIDEYITITSLGMPDDVLQLGYFNINIHIKDREGLVQNKRLYDEGKAVMAAIKAANPLINGQYIHFEQKFETLLQGKDSDHFLNIRYLVGLLN